MAKVKVSDRYVATVVLPKNDKMHDATNQQVFNELSLRFGRKPTASDLYSVAKEFYNSFQYQKAARVLELYASLPGKTLSGLHLLGYSYYMIGDLSNALSSFKRCVNEGFDADWQLLIEIQLEINASGGASCIEERHRPRTPEIESVSVKEPASPEVSRERLGEVVGGARPGKSSPTRKSGKSSPMRIPGKFSPTRKSGKASPTRTTGKKGIEK